MTQVNIFQEVNSVCLVARSNIIFINVFLSFFHQDFSKQNIKTWYPKYAFNLPGLVYKKPWRFIIEKRIDTKTFGSPKIFLLFSNSASEICIYRCYFFDIYHQSAHQLHYQLAKMVSKIKMVFEPSLWDSEFNIFRFQSLKLQLTLPINYMLKMVLECLELPPSRPINYMIHLFFLKWKFLPVE